jgi:hypothetical protein
VSHNTVLTNWKQPHRSGSGRNSQSPDYMVNPEKKLVIVRFRKKLSFDEIGQYAELLRANTAFQPSFAEIVDLTQVEEFKLDADDFLKLADEVDPFSIDAKRAFVARNTMQNHAARMHKILRTQRKFEIFSTMQEAERWVAD